MFIGLCFLVMSGQLIKVFPIISNAQLSKIKTPKNNQKQRFFHETKNNDNLFQLK
jgi:hypothetical protein